MLVIPKAFNRHPVRTQQKLVKDKVYIIHVKADYRLPSTEC